MNESEVRNGLDGLFSLSAKWTEQQQREAKALSTNLPDLVDLARVKLKENRAALAKDLLEFGAPFTSTSANDILHLAVEVSDADASGRIPLKFRPFTHKQRRLFVRALRGCKNLKAEMARYPKIWKQFVAVLRPADHSEFGDGILAAVDALVHGTLPRRAVAK